MSTTCHPALAFGLACLLAGTALPGSLHAQTFERVYLDDRHNVHAVTAGGRHARLTGNNDADQPKLAPDKQTLAWLVSRTWTVDGDPISGSEELVIYRHGRRQSIHCQPFIRAYWFWNKGRQVAIDCGGLHFAGTEILYDARTLKELARIDQGTVPFERRPPWSTGAD